MRNKGNRVPCRPRLSLGFAVILLTVPTRAQATGSVAFTWLAPAGCPAESEVAAEIARLLGTSSPAPAHGQLHVRASVEHGSPWSISIESSSGASQGYRTLSATSCEELANATALIVALMIDPSVAAVSLCRRDAGGMLDARLPVSLPGSLWRPRIRHLARPRVGRHPASFPDDTLAGIGARRLPGAQGERVALFSHPHRRCRSDIAARFRVPKRRQSDLSGIVGRRSSDGRRRNALLITDPTQTWHYHVT